MKIYQVETSDQKQQVQALFWEYLEWANQNLNKVFDINFDIAAIIEDDMKTLGKFMPPDGRLLLADVDGAVAGLACMKPLNETICEVKRMYVRPDFRGQGVGRALLQGLIDEGREMGFLTIRLDSARFMTPAHALYRSAGFQEIAPYAGSEIAPEFQQHWIFMEMPLR
ncbi:MAG: GNAT family N-acetyltransferase [Anaerolineae bacterium]|nr:GNAT family N-acetyltransferase [Anaerolineae bacterium]